MMIRNVRLSFPHLFKPHAFDENAEARYQGTFIVPKDHPQIDEIRAEIARVKKEEWGDKKVNVKKCLREGSEKDDLDGFGEDVMFFNASNSARPRVLDRVRDPNTGKARIIMDSSEGIPYAGCYVNADIDFWTQDNKYGKRVNAGLRGIQFWKDGERFGGGGVSSAGDFDVVDDDEAGADWEEDDMLD